MRSDSGRIRLVAIGTLSLASLVFLPSLWPQQPPARAAGATRVYVGSDKCGECHDQEFRAFQAYARMGRSFEGVEKMKDVLDPEELKQCYACHTTGYGEPGGFQSEQATPQLRNVGCETCHGAGSAHIESGEKKDLRDSGKVSAESCARCHTTDRVAAFHYKPMLRGGAH